MATKKHLFFIAGIVPTTTERAQAAALGTKMFRNASQASDSIESGTTHVSGQVPEIYTGAKAQELKIEVVEVPAAEESAIDETATQGGESEQVQTETPAEAPKAKRGKKK